MYVGQHSVVPILSCFAREITNRLNFACVILFSVLQFPCMPVIAGLTLYWNDLVDIDILDHFWVNNMTTLPHKTLAVHTTIRRNYFSFYLLSKSIFYFLFVSFLKCCNLANPTKMDTPPLKNMLFKWIFQTSVKALRNIKRVSGSTAKKHYKCFKMANHEKIKINIKTGNRGNKSGKGNKFQTRNIRTTTTKNILHPRFPPFRISSNKTESGREFSNFIFPR